MSEPDADAAYRDAEHAHVPAEPDRGHIAAQLDRSRRGIAAGEE